MKKIKWNILIATCFVCLAPVLFGVAMWNQLPNQIAIHFDINNQPDNYAPKWFGVFGLPVMMVIFQVVCCIVTDFNAQKHGEQKKVEAVSKWSIPVVTVMMYFVTLGFAMGWNIDIRRVAVFLVSVLFLILGNYLPKLNYVKNYRLDTEVARKINRFTGFAMVIMGVLGLISILFAPVFSVVWLVLLIPCVIVTLVYSICAVRKNRK